MDASPQTLAPRLIGALELVARLYRLARGVGLFPLPPVLVPVTGLLQHARWPDYADSTKMITQIGSDEHICEIAFKNQRNHPPKPLLRHFCYERAVSPHETSPIFPGMIHPKEDSPVTDSILLQPMQIAWEVPERMTQDFRMDAEPPEFFSNLTSRRRVEPFEVAVEGRSGLQLVHQADLLAGPDEGVRVTGEVFSVRASELLHNGRLVGDQVILQLIAEVSEDNRGPQHLLDNALRQCDRLHGNTLLVQRYHVARTVSSLPPQPSSESR